MLGEVPVINEATFLDRSNTDLSVVWPEHRAQRASKQQVLNIHRTPRREKGTDDAPLKIYKVYKTGMPLARGTQISRFS